MLSLVHARTFLAVIDARGFRPAARSLGLAASTVVEHVDQLEIELATPLLVRARGRVRPTEGGALLVPLARALVDTATRAHDVLRLAPLRVAASSNVGVYLLQPWLASFVATSGIAVEPWIGPNPEVAQRLQTGRADAAVMEWWDDRPGFDAIAWRREPMVVIVPPSHKWARRRVVKAEDLLGETMLGGESGSGTATVLRQALGALADRLSMRAGYGSTEAVKRAVRAGQGVSIVLAASVTDEVTNGSLSALQVNGARLAKQISVIVPKGLREASAALRFARHIAG